MQSVMVESFELMVVRSYEVPFIKVFNCKPEYEITGWIFGYRDACEDCGIKVRFFCDKGNIEINPYDELDEKANEWLGANTL